MTYTELKAKGWKETGSMVFEKDFLKIVFEESSQKGKYLLIDEVNKCFVSFKNTLSEILEEAEKYLKVMC